MPIQVKFYGDLKEKIQAQQTTDVGSPNIVNIENKGINNVYIMSILLAFTEIN